MKIYTKTGDKGTTSLVGGKRVDKDHARIEAYGTVDELISHLGVVRSLIVSDEIKSEILNIQNKLMDCAALLAAESDVTKQLPKVNISDVNDLEKCIDTMNLSLPPLESFIIPGESTTSAVCHVARSVCRRTERRIVTLARQTELDENMVKYINRLSDYLFTLARFVEKQVGKADVLWKPDFE